MRLFVLEVKRVLKTRMTWILILLALALSALMAYIPVTFEEVLITDETGQEIRLSGLDAIHYYQQYNHSLARAAWIDVLGLILNLAFTETYQWVFSIFSENGRSWKHIN